MGESLKEHIRRLRLEGAASQLKHTYESVINIAFDAGYQTREAFARAFKAIFGCSPSGFRNNCSTSQRILAKYQNDRQVNKRDKNKINGDEIAVQTIGGGEYAVTTHFGPYDNLSQTYSRLSRDWLIKSEREISQDPCMEFYLNDPESTDPEDLLTDVCLPLKPKR